MNNLYVSPFNYPGSMKEPQSFLWCETSNMWKFEKTESGHVYIFIGDQRAKQQNGEEYGHVLFVAPGDNSDQFKVSIRMQFNTESIVDYIK